MICGRQPGRPAGGPVQRPAGLDIPLTRLTATVPRDNARLIGRVLAIQPKRTTTTIVSFLTRGELNAVLAAPDRATWHGRRDHALLVFAAQTGLRVSELTGLAVNQVHLGAGPHAYCHGKGRKDRATPLTAHTVEVLAAWLAEQHADPASPLFATRAGTPLSRDAVQHLATRHAATAARTCPSLQAKNVTPHTLRHTAAMNLLHAGVDITVIALWLGHENPSPRASTCTPTWHSKKGPSPAPPRPTPRPGATSHPTNCWPSSASFGGAQFSGGTVDFGRAKFSGGEVRFARARFTGGEVRFSEAQFSGGTVSFADPGAWSHPPLLGWNGKPPAGVTLP